MFTICECTDYHVNQFLCNCIWECNLPTGIVHEECIVQVELESLLENASFALEDCTAKCPKGTYNDKIGARSILDCKPCPAGVYGSTTGLTTSQCSGPCPNGKYSMNEGLQTIGDCIDCPALYRGPQGYRGNDVTMRNGGGYPCDRYQYGKTISNGRDANTNAWWYGYLSQARIPTNEEIVDNTTPW
ncbi:hypothetical protein PHMEG_00021406 [Phytophthora megakarya]|uniref:Tyrosine-protein kinase ephrin type A/B receptor-like domain-containing protein n=1 Tax=Phytophthora megakarya TaxID=4795 RepID=A0A225VMV1_9STRA|nr:hypothetical protein PHMEG_00021406 [Phytophthora megakarya]